MGRKHILIALGAVLALTVAATIGMRSYWTQRRIVAWRVRHNLPLQLAGVKFHVPPSLSFYQPRFEPQGRWWFIRTDRSNEGQALYVIETNDHAAPELTSSSSSVGSRRFVRTLPVALAGKNGLCAEFEERMELDVGPPFISIDCSFGPRLGVMFLGRAQGVREFYRFIQAAEGGKHNVNSKTVQYAESNNIITITLNRPDKRNAISYELIDDLIAALRQAVSASPNIVILTGAGSAFCAGMDLDNLKQLIGRSGEQNLKDSETMAGLFRTLYDFPKVTIAAVNGAAIAGGTALATLCDFTLAVPGAKFGYTEVRIGFVPGIVSTYLINNIGEKRARDLLLTGRLFDAEEAHQLGLVNEVVGPDRLMQRAHELAAQLMEISPASLKVAKGLLSSFTKDQLDRQLPRAVQENAAIRQTADFKEGVTSFLEMRKPKWTTN